MYLKLLEKVVHGNYMGFIWTWWHGYSWHLIHSRIFMFYNKFGCKMTRHEANTGEINGGNWESVFWVLLPMYKAWWCLFYIVHVTLWHELLMSSFYLYTTIVYYFWYSFSLGYMDAFLTSSFQTMIIINWYAGINCGIENSHFHILGSNWHA